MPINFVICNASLELFSGNKKHGQTKHTLLLTNVHNNRDSTSSLDDSVDYEHSDKHNERRNFSKRESTEFRPDILHFSLLSLHDSILNKEGKIQVYLQSLDGRVYKISNQFRVPRTFKVFNKVFANYLHSKSKTLTTESGEVLVELIDEPLDSLVPDNAIKVAVDNKSSNLNIGSYLGNMSSDLDGIWFFISASPSLPLEGLSPSHVVDVSNVHKGILSRDEVKKSSNDPNQLESLEESYLNYNHKDEKSCKYNHSFSFRQYNLSCLANCYTLVCTIESLLGY